MTLMHVNEQEILDGRNSKICRTHLNRCRQFQWDDIMGAHKEILLVVLCLSLSLSQP